LEEPKTLQSLRQCGPGFNQIQGEKCGREKENFNKNGLQRKAGVVLKVASLRREERGQGKRLVRATRRVNNGEGVSRTQVLIEGKLERQ